MSWSWRWSGTKAKAQRHSRQEALSVGHERLSLKSRRTLAGICAVFLILGSVTLYFITIRPLWGVYSARSWATTPCTIVSSEVKVHRDGDGETYSIAITYQYEYDRVQYTGDRYHFMAGGSSSGRRGKQAVVDAYPPGLKTVCYVNPNDPREAVIERGLTVDFLWGAFPLPFLAVGIGGLLFASGLVKHSPPADGALADALSGFDPAQPARISADATADGPVTLKPHVPPWGLLLGALFVCLFWNGLLSIPVRQIVSGHRAGNPDWFLTVFIIPFVLVGFGLVGWVGYAILCLFNPRPELTLSRGTLPLGSAVQAAWRFRGRTNSIRRLTLSLKGEEHAKFRSGKNTATHQETFYEQVFYETENILDIASGQAEFQVPSDSMHSFDAKNNKIEWSVQMVGEIKNWPDIKMSFLLRVTPQERNAP